MAQTVLAYLRHNLLIEGETGSDFMKMWKSLDEKDKADLKAWAEEEMAL